MGPLPGTIAEVDRIRAQIGREPGALTWLNSEQATVGAVLEAMETHSWIHLACHDVQGQLEPTKSAFALYDGRLDLETISSLTASGPSSSLTTATRRGQRSKNNSFAFLSACQTATGSEQLPEEAVHLAAGVLMAGYRTVLATMWSISDKHAPMVAEDVYRQLSKDRLLRTHEGQAAYALHYAVERLRTVVGESSFMTWVPFIHLGV